MVLLKELFYLANIIDYGRIVTLYWAVRSDDAHTFALWYSISYLLDIIDGPVARAMGQESVLGYYLDMVVDRVSSCVCLHFAAQAVLTGNTAVSTAFVTPVVAVCYFCLVMVEIVAHGAVIILAEVVGIHQKKLGFDFGLVRLYLGDKRILGWSCISFEVLGLGLVTAIWPAVLIGLPGFVFRALANLCRLLSIILSREELRRDDKTG